MSRLDFERSPGAWVDAIIGRLEISVGMYSPSNFLGIIDSFIETYMDEREISHLVVTS